MGLWVTMWCLMLCLGFAKLKVGVTNTGLPCRSELVGGGFGDITDAGWDFLEDAVDDEGPFRLSDLFILEVHEETMGLEKVCPQDRLVNVS